MSNFILKHSNRHLVITCGGCGVEVYPQFTPDGLRQLPAYCECGFLNVDPRIVDVNKPAETVAGESAEAA